MRNEISPERIRRALKLIEGTGVHGDYFEQFVKDVLVETEGYFPAGGTHDRGIDLVRLTFTEDGSEYLAILQASVSKNWERKIRATIDRLSKEGIRPTELVYATNLNISSEAEPSLGRIRRSTGLMVTVRDGEYFVSKRNHSPTVAAACEVLAQRILDPLLSSSPTPVYGDEDLGLAAAYFNLLLAEKDDEKNLKKFCYESLIKYVLRGTSGGVEQQLPIGEVVAQIRAFLPLHDPRHVEDSIRGRINHLKRRRVLNWTASGDRVGLSNDAKNELDELRGRQKEVEQDSVLAAEGLVKRRTRILEIDYEFDPRCVAEAALVLAEWVLAERAHHIAEATDDNSGSYEPPRTEAIQDTAQRLRRQRPDTFAMVANLDEAQFLDLIPEVTKDCLLCADEVIRDRLRRGRDAFCLLFLFRGHTNIQQVVNRIAADVRLVIDSNVLIETLSAILLDEPGKDPQSNPIGQLLETARDIDIDLVTTAGYINEAHSHFNNAIRSIDHFYSNDAAHSDTQAVAIVYLKRGGSTKHFKELVRDRLYGDRDPAFDIAQLLERRYGVRLMRSERDNLPGELLPVDEREYAEAFDYWRNRQSGQLAHDKADLLARHDAEAFAAVSQLRREAGGSGEVTGPRWWLLTLDARAFGMDTKRRDKSNRVCMHPEVLASMLSVRASNDNNAVIHTLPLAIDLASVELAENRGALSSIAAAIHKSRDRPRYVQERHIRDTLYTLRSAPIEPAK